MIGRELFIHEHRPRSKRSALALSLVASDCRVFGHIRGDTFTLADGLVCENPSIAMQAVRAVYDRLMDEESGCE